MDSKTVEVINTSAGEKTYSIEAGFRYADDEDAGVEVMLSADTLTVAAGGTGTFDVDMHVDPPDAQGLDPLTAAAPSAPQAATC